MDRIEELIRNLTSRSFWEKIDSFLPSEYTTLVLPPQDERKFEITEIDVKNKTITVLSTFFDPLEELKSLYVQAYSGSISAQIDFGKFRQSARNGFETHLVTKYDLSDLKIINSDIGSPDYTIIPYYGIEFIGDEFLTVSPSEQARCFAEIKYDDFEFYLFSFKHSHFDHLFGASGIICVKSEHEDYVNWMIKASTGINHRLFVKIRIHEKHEEFELQTDAENDCEQTPLDVMTFELSSIEVVRELSVAYPMHSQILSVAYPGTFSLFVSECFRPFIEEHTKWDLKQLIDWHVLAVQSPNKEQKALLIAIFFEKLKDVYARDKGYKQVDTKWRDSECNEKYFITLIEEFIQDQNYLGINLNNKYFKEMKNMRNNIVHEAKVEQRVEFVMELQQLCSIIILKLLKYPDSARFWSRKQNKWTTFVDVIQDYF